MRARAEGAKVLVDATRFAPQVAVVAAALGEHTRRLYTPADRVAVVAGSALLRMQAVRVSDIRQHRVFEVRRDAEAYLAG